MPGWLEELTEANVGSLEIQEDCGLSEAAEGWTLLGCWCCCGVAPGCRGTCRPLVDKEGSVVVSMPFTVWFIQHQFIDIYMGHIAC